MLEDDMGAPEVVVVLLDGVEDAAGAEEDEACEGFVAAVAEPPAAGCSEDDDVVVDNDEELLERFSPPRVRLVEDVVSPIADANVYVEAAATAAAAAAEDEVAVVAVVAPLVSSRVRRPLLRSLLVREMASTAGRSEVESPSGPSLPSTWSVSESVSADTPESTTALLLLFLAALAFLL